MRLCLNSDCLPCRVGISHENINQSGLSPRAESCFTVIAQTGGCCTFDLFLGFPDHTVLATSLLL